MNRLLRVLATVVASLLVWGASSARAQVTARVSMSADRETVSVGERFILEVRADVSGATVDDVKVPDLSAFRVVGRQRSTPIQFQFGFGANVQMVQSTTVETFELIADAPGRYSIGPAQVKAGGRVFRTEGVVVNVVQGRAPVPSRIDPRFDPNGAFDVTPPSSTSSAPMPEPPAGTLQGAIFDPQCFLRVVTDKTSVFAGEQLTVTIYLYVRGAVRAAPVATREASTDGFWVHDLLPPSRALEATQQVVGGVPFRVYMLRRFAAFPLRDGTLVIGPMTVNVETGGIFDLFGPPPEALVREGVPVAIEVKPLPSTGRTGEPVVVGANVALEAALDRDQAVTGDAVKLTATVRGSGNFRDLRLEVSERAGLRVLPPEVHDNVEAPSDVIGGSRTFEWLVIPERPGTYALAPLVVQAFDPSTGAYARVVGPSLTLTASGNAIGGADPEALAASSDVAPAQEDPTASEPLFGPLRTRSELRRREDPISSRPWFWIALAGMALSYGGLSIALISRRARARRDAGAATQSAARSAKKRLEKAEIAAKSGDAKAFYAEAGAALRAGVSAQLGEPIGGLTLAALRDQLVARGMEADLAMRVVEEIEACEFARFSASATAEKEIAHARDRVAALLTRVGKWRAVS